MAAGRRGAGPRVSPGGAGPAWFPRVPVLFLDGSRLVFAPPWVPHPASLVSREESLEGGSEAAGPGPERAGIVRFELAEPQRAGKSKEQTFPGSLPQFLLCLRGPNPFLFTVGPTVPSTCNRLSPQARGTAGLGPH